MNSIIECFKKEFGSDPARFERGYSYALTIPPQRPHHKQMVIVGTIHEDKVSALNAAVATLRNDRGYAVLMIHPCHHLPVFESVLHVFSDKLDTSGRAKRWRQFGRAEAFRTYSKEDINRFTRCMVVAYAIYSKFIAATPLPFEINIPRPDTLIADADLPALRLGCDFRNSSPGEIMEAVMDACATVRAR